MFAFTSAPLNTAALSPSPPHPSLAVSGETKSGPRAPPRSLPSSRRRRSPTSSAPPPQVFALRQCPLTLCYSLTTSPLRPSPAVSPTTKSERRAPLHSLPSSKRQRSPSSSAPRPRTSSQVSTAVDMLALPPFPLSPSLSVSDSTISEPRVPLRSPPSSRRQRSPTWGAPPPECLVSCQCPLTLDCHSPPLQLGEEPALRPRLHGQRHLHLRGHHQAVRGTQGKRRDLAQVHRHPSVHHSVNAR